MRVRLEAWLGRLLAGRGVARVQGALGQAGLQGAWIRLREVVLAHLWVANGSAACHTQLHPRAGTEIQVACI